MPKKKPPKPRGHRPDAAETAFLTAKKATGDYRLVLRGPGYPLGVGEHDTITGSGGQWRVYSIGPPKEGGTVEVELVRD